VEVLCECNIFRDFCVISLFFNNNTNSPLLVFHTHVIFKYQESGGQNRDHKLMLFKFFAIFFLFLSAQETLKDELNVR